MIFFLLFAGLTIGCAIIVAFTKNIVHAGFALLGTLGGVAGLFVMLSADFVAVIQLLIYVGGVLVLILFGVMLTSKIGIVKVTNESVGRLPVGLLCGLLFILLSKVVMTGTWHGTEAAGYVVTTAPIGNALLGPYLLPFEVASIVLLGALVGAVLLVRRQVK